MTKDIYWDDLGIAWIAFDPNLADTSPKLVSRVRRETRLFRLGFFAATSVSLIGLFGGIWTVWLGITFGIWNFATRGIAIILIGLLAAIAAHEFWSAGASSENCTGSEMIEMTIVRARRLLLTIRLGLSACVLAAIFGVIGTIIRSHSSRPPNLPPAVDLILLALVALVLGLYGQRVKVKREKFEYLRRIMAAE